MAYSMRGSGKFAFQPGEYVLCFEPDVTKARVLYDAKVLDASSYRDTKGRTKAEYHIHFQGWNSSWDRIVPEYFVLKDTARNRELKMHLAEITRCMKDHKQRNKRIKAVLFEHFNKHIRFDSSSDEEEDSDNESVSSGLSEESESSFEVLPSRQRPRGQDTQSDDEDKENRDVNNRAKESSTRLQTESDVEEREEVASESGDENELVLRGFINETPKPIELEIPDNLKQKLVEDHANVNTKKMLVNLPADPCVIGLLEGYVKNFAVNVLCNSMEKLRPSYSRENGTLLLEKNIDLCKEVVDGLRVMFDFALPTLLLYNFERAQFTKLCTSFIPSSSIKKEMHDMEEDDEIDFPKSPRLRSTTRHQSMFWQEEPPTKQSKHLTSHTEKDSDSEEEDETPRRVTRRAFAEETRKRTESTSGGHKKSHTVKTPQTPDKPEKSDAGNRRESLRSRTRHASGTSVFSTSRDEEEEKSEHGEEKKDEAPKGADGPEGTQPAESVSGASEAELQNVLNWKLIPDEVYKQSPPPPSTMYGSQHLLRLFVKLPEVLGKMAIPERKIRPILRHVEMFLSYLSDRVEELLPDGAYTEHGSHSKHSKGS